VSHQKNKVRFSWGPALLGLVCELTVKTTGHTVASYENSFNCVGSTPVEKEACAEEINSTLGIN
jgi:hypothetical protein